LNSDKIKSYIGFAVKKGSVVYGLDSLELYRKKVHIVLYSPLLAENSLKKLKAEVVRFKCECHLFDTLSDTLRKNCKVLGITDKSLADAVKNNLL
jgi:hypothetical protein